MLVEEHDGVVPKTFEELEKLPGVGHKTASVVICTAFGSVSFSFHMHHCLLWCSTTSKRKKSISVLFTRFFSLDRGGIHERRVYSRIPKGSAPMHC